MADDITPSNTSPVQLTANQAVKPTTAGYAIASYDSVTPSSTPESVSSGDIVKIGGNGVIVDAVPTPTSITPSNSSPVALTANTPVNPTASGYAIESYQSKTPSTGGVSFNSGFVKMSSSGYAYPARPTLKATTLWTNNSPTSSFSAQTVTLSQDIDNYAYIGFRYAASTSSSAETNEVIVTPENLKKSIAGNSKARISIGCTNSSGSFYLRSVAYSSDTSISINNAYRENNNAGTSNTLCIPTSIVGYYISA